MKKMKLANDLKPSEQLMILAKQEAAALGHTLGRFTELVSNWSAQCTTCYRCVSIRPQMLPKDGKGRGGKALSERCVWVPPDSSMKLAKEEVSE